MLKNISKISKHTAFLILVIVVAGLLNFCLFAFQAKIAQSIESQKLNLANSNNGNCLTEPVASEPKQTIAYPSAPMPECCLAQNRNFNALINAAVNQLTLTFVNPAILSTNNSNSENNYSDHTARLTYPPPAALALATTIMRE